MSQLRPSGALRFGLPGLLIGLALAWWAGGPGSTARLLGQQRPAVAADPGPGSLIAFTSPPSATSSSQLLYLIDPKVKSFAIYRVDQGNSKETGTVKLIAARQCAFDLKMTEFNNGPPEVSSIEAALKAMPK